MEIVTRGLGHIQMLATQGYGAVTKDGEEFKLDSRLTTLLVPKSYIGADDVGMSSSLTTIVALKSHIDL